MLHIFVIVVWIFMHCDITTIQSRPPTVYDVLIKCGSIISYKSNDLKFFEQKLQKMTLKDNKNMSKEFELVTGNKNMNWKICADKVGGYQLRKAGKDLIYVYFVLTE